MSAMQQDLVDVKLTNNQELLDEYQCGCSIVRGKGVVLISLALNHVFIPFFPFIGTSSFIILMIIYKVASRQEGREREDDMQVRAQVGT